MAAIGDVIAIVHADTRVTSSVFTQIINVLGKQPMIVGGAVGGIFDASSWCLRVIEFANNFRIVFLGISFGDQIQFFRRKPVVDLNIFPDIPLMEDVKFSLRLHRLCRQIFLWENSLISSRRWKEGGFRRSFMVIQLTAVYLWQHLWKKPDTLLMYRRYYEN